MKSRIEQLEKWLQKLEQRDRQVIGAYNKMRPKHPAEVIKELYEQNNVDGIWSVHLDDVEFPFEVENWMYAYATSLQPKRKPQTKVCGKCYNRGWIYNDEDGTKKTCECHY